MRADLPNLKHHLIETFRSLSWLELMKLDKKNDANGKSGKKLTEKLARNWPARTTGLTFCMI